MYVYSQACAEQALKCLNNLKPETILETNLVHGLFRAGTATGNGTTWVHVRDTFDAVIDYKADIHFDLVIVGAGIIDLEDANEIARALTKLKAIAKTIWVIRHKNAKWSAFDLKNIFGDDADEYYPLDGEAVMVWNLKPVETKPKLMICVYTIAKDEKKHLKQFYEGAKDADLVLIGDTGSTDGSMEEYSQMVHDGLKNFECVPISIQPWRFDKARDAVLSLIPPDYDVCVSIDMDEVLQPGWREEIERIWVKGKTTRLQCLYDWGQNKIFAYEKVHARSGYFWKYPCHEYLEKDPRAVEQLVVTGMVMVKHFPDDTKSRGSYRDLLAMGVQEDPTCWRSRFYYSRDLVDAGEWSLARESLLQYLQLPKATWNLERSYAMWLLAKCDEKEFNFDSAWKWHRLSVAEAPEFRDSWCHMAQYALNQKKYNDAYYAATKALEVTRRIPAYMVDNQCWTAWPHDILASAANELGLVSIACTHTKIALQTYPEDARLLANLKALEQYLEGMKINGGPGNEQCSGDPGDGDQRQRTVVDPGQRPGSVVP